MDWKIEGLNKKGNKHSKHGLLCMLKQYSEFYFYLEVQSSTEHVRPAHNKQAGGA